MNSTIETTNTKLQFHKTGSFRILTMSDFHIGTCVIPKFTEGMEALLNEAQPDFVMLIGDQCLGGDTVEATRNMMLQVIAPILKRNLPWGAVFGNHDREVGIDTTIQEEIYESIPGYVGTKAPDDVFGAGIYQIPIYHHNSDEVDYRLWCLDSLSEVDREMMEHSSIPAPKAFKLPHMFTYAGNNCMPLFDQVMWYYSESVRLEKETGKKSPALMFMHTPVPEICHIYRNPEQCHAIGDARETPGCCEINTGLFAAALQRGDVKGMFFGHEHLINLQGEYCGITLAYDGSLGYAMSTHDDLRGGRIIDITENGSMTTHFVRLIDLLGEKAYRNPNFFEGGCNYHIRIFD